MRMWLILVAFVSSCGNENDGADVGGLDIGDDASETDDESGPTGDDDDASASDGMTDASATESATETADDSDSSDDDDSGPVGPMCDGKLWRATMDVDPTTLDDNGDSIQDWEFNAGAFPADQLMDGVWHAAPGAYVRTLPDDPLATRVIVQMRMRSTTASNRGALFWANLGQEDDSVTRLWLDLAMNAEGSQVALVGGYSAGDMPELLLEVPDLGAGFVDVVLDADPVTSTAIVTINGVDHGMLELPSYDGSNPQAAAVGALEASAEIDDVQFELCP
jgi:hypothetical protein